MIDTRILRTSLIPLAAMLVALPSLPAGIEAQQPGGRYRVLVANLLPTDGTRARFGERASDRLRDILDLDTHVAMSGRDINNAAREFDLNLERLDCTFATQLAAQISIPVVFCGEYRTVGDQIEYSGKFVTVPGAEEFAFDPQQVPENQDQQAAQTILAFFEETVDRLNQISYCGQDFNSQNWEGALDYCQRAVELAPGSREARTALARTYMELERFEESAEQWEILLDQDPYNSAALESAGWVAAQLGSQDQARDYYGRYLELNPSDVQVRIQIANDLATSGDDLGAMRLLEAGFEQDPENVDLHLQYGAMAFRAAATMEMQSPQPQTQDGGPAPVSDEVVELYRTAVNSLEVVLEARGAEMRPSDVVNMLRAYVKIGDTQTAVALGDRIVQHFSENPQVLSELAATYNRAGMVDRAIERMNRALEIDPNLPDARFRMASILLQAGRVDEAVEWVGRAQEAGEREPDTLALLLFGHGWNEGVQKGDRQLGVRMFNAAKGISGTSPQFRSQVNFFHGYTLFQPRDAAFREDTSLQACQTHLPGIRESLTYLPDGQQYAQQAGQNLQAIIDAANQWIEVCEAVIQRESRGG